MALSSHARVLEDLLASCIALLSEFVDALGPDGSAADLSDGPIKDPPNALDVLRDASKLVKAHTTKITLLAINKPFTSSALTKVLKEMAGTCLPAMMTGARICEQESATWSKMVAGEAKMRVRRVFREAVTLLEEVRAITRENGGSTRRDSLRSTGVVWESCDAVVELQQLGIAGLAVQRAEQYRATIQDAIQELKEWREGEDRESEGHDELLDESDEAVAGDTDSVEDIFHAANSMPKDRPELEQLLLTAEGKLKKVVLLYTALIKRRLKTFVGAESGDVDRLDNVMDNLKALPHHVDEMASCFYDLDDQRAKAMLDKCVHESVRAAAAMRLKWLAEEDEFTKWSVRWTEAIS